MVAVLGTSNIPWGAARVRAGVALTAAISQVMSESALPASYNPFRVLLDQPKFRLFWIGQTLSLVGTWMQSMAQGWLALELSNSASFVGLVATGRITPG